MARDAGPDVLMPLLPLMLSPEDRRRPFTKGQSYKPWGEGINHGDGTGDGCGEGYYNGEHEYGNRWGSGTGRGWLSGKGAGELP